MPGRAQCVCQKGVGTSRQIERGVEGLVPHRTQVVPRCPELSHLRPGAVQLVPGSSQVVPHAGESSVRIPGRAERHARQVPQRRPVVSRERLGDVSVVVVAADGHGARRRHGRDRGHRGGAESGRGRRRGRGRHVHSCLTPGALRTASLSTMAPRTSPAKKQTEVSNKTKTNILFVVYRFPLSRRADVHHYRFSTSAPDKLYCR